MVVNSIGDGMTKNIVAQPGPEPFAQYNNRISTRLAVLAGLIIGLLVILLNTDRTLIPLSDDLRSFGVIAFLALLPLTAIMAGLGFVLGVRGWNHRVGAARQRGWFIAFLPIALAYMVVTGGMVFVLLTLLEHAFRQLQLSPIQSALLAGSGAAALTYWVVGNAMQIDTQRLLKLAVTILTGGVYLALVTIDAPLWWRVSFSYLGRLDSNVNFIFNTTLILAGALLLVWHTYLMKDYRFLLRHGLADPRWALLPRYGLLWVGIAVMIVGLFKSQLPPLAHSCTIRRPIRWLVSLASLWAPPGGLSLAFPANFMRCRLRWLLCCSASSSGRSAAA